jgi:hypothetical protein
MIPIKKCNFITGQKNDIIIGSNLIINFLELNGRNYLLLTNDFSSTLLSNKYIFNNLSEFKEIINNKSKLFRIDLLVFDFMNLSMSDVIEYKKEIDKLDITHIILAKQYYYKSSDDITDYHIRTEFEFDKNKISSDFKSRIIITDNINKWSSDLENLIKSYIRSVKIDNLFN